MTKARQNIKMTFKIHGRDMTLSMDELIKILEKHFSTEPIKKTVQSPSEGEWFEVNPDTIDQSLFYKIRPDLKQEEARKLILQAFDAVKIKPWRYGKKFYTLIPRIHWYWDEEKTIRELLELHRNLGDHNADWVEQALEWAQRICNGESWKELCNEWDKCCQCRLIEWNGEKQEFRTVGGGKFSASLNVCSIPRYYNDALTRCVPLMVTYDK